MNFENTLAFAQQLDQKDPLAIYREQFYFPQHEGKPVVYFTGNSLGLQPKIARKYVEAEMKKWEEYAVEGHFKPQEPWIDYHKILREPLSRVVGAKVEEVTVMNTLTVNVHLMMVSFYRPQAKRFKILMEGGAFPSDQYAAESQVKFHGYDPEEAIVEVKPRAGEDTLRTEDIIAKIQELGDELALVLFGGINYATGQFFDLGAIAQAGHKVGALVGYDLAHAAGNVPLSLHDWGADFATWCSYKYLNAGPGGISGVFVHEKHLKDPNIPRFTGWWGYDEKTRFLMKKGFVPEPDVDAWQLSNAPVLLLASHRASLEVFDKIGMNKLRQKSELLTAYLEFITLKVGKELDLPISILTPQDQSQRGCQLSICLKDQGKSVFNELIAAGVIVDWREPSIIRAAPTPMYNNFEDIFRFGKILKSILQK